MTGHVLGSLALESFDGGSCLRIVYVGSMEYRKSKY